MREQIARQLEEINNNLRLQNGILIDLVKYLKELKEVMEE